MFPVEFETASEDLLTIDSRACRDQSRVDQNKESEWQYYCALLGRGIVESEESEGTKKIGSVSCMIDIEFNVFSDTPSGKDPDSYSSTLRSYHRELWSKPLPSGELFALDLDTPRLLHHHSALGEFFLSSDAIGHTYKGVKRMAHIVQQLPTNELNHFFSLCSTIGAFIVFPAKRIDGKMTINGARGTNHKIHDRFDLTLECVRRFYAGEESPLSTTFERYSSFFALFENFRGYVEFFLLNDLVCSKFEEVKFWHQFSSFDLSPLPQTITEYYDFKMSVEKFVRKRNKRINSYARNQLAQ